MLARHYEAASPGRRTANWNRARADANVASGPALADLRAHARDLVRNNSWARNGKRTIRDNTVGWGIQPKAVDAGAQGPAIGSLWKRWAESTDCDADGRLTFYGLQKLIMSEVAEAGEVLVRRRMRQKRDGLPIPMQLQVLEADFIDTMRNGIQGQEGGPIIHGVEFDAIGRRVAYWLFDKHPGSNLVGTSAISKRVTASDIAHIYEVERAGQVRGISWYSPAIVSLKDFDEFEDSTLLRQKIAACFAGFVTDYDGEAGGLIGQATTDPQAQPGDAPIETLEPGMIMKLPPGKQITFAVPPGAPDDGFSERTLRRIAAGLGVTYEDLTGDYSQVNFSSARMARLKHWSHVAGWRWDMLIPQFCDPAWRWAMDAATIAGSIQMPDGVAPLAQWTPPPMPMIEPDKEGLALQRMVRSGAMTPSEMVREQGYDPETHWQEFKDDLDKLDELGIVLDCDPRKVSQTGQTQKATGGAGDGEDAQAAANAQRAAAEAEALAHDRALELARAQGEASARALAVLAPRRVPPAVVKRDAAGRVVEIVPAEG
jgi:lambda family phage portal protein